MAVFKTFQIVRQRLSGGFPLYLTAYVCIFHLHVSCALETNSLEHAANFTTEWEAPVDIVKSFPYYFSGFDDENRPVLICEFGKWDLRKYFEDGKDIQILQKYLNQALDRFISGPPREKYPEGDIASGTVLIADLDGFSARQVASADTFRLILRTASKLAELEKHLAYGFLINLNYVAQRSMEVSRPLLGSFLERIEAFGANPAKWKPRLLRVIPKDQLPPWYGGSADFSPVAIYG